MGKVKKGDYYWNIGFSKDSYSIPWVSDIIGRYEQIVFDSKESKTYIWYKKGILDGELLNALRGIDV